MTLRMFSLAMLVAVFGAASPATVAATSDDVDGTSVPVLVRFGSEGVGHYATVHECEADNHAARCKELVAKQERERRREHRQGGTFDPALCAPKRCDQRGEPPDMYWTYASCCYTIGNGR